MLLLSENRRLTTLWTTQWRALSVDYSALNLHSRTLAGIADGRWPNESLLKIVESDSGVTNELLARAALEGSGTRRQTTGYDGPVLRRGHSRDRSADSWRWHRAWTERTLLALGVWSSDSR